MIKLAFVFRSAPYGSAAIREGLDALLAASAFCEEDQIAVFFLEDGVLNLLPNQQSALILQKDVAASLKLLTLYDIEQCYLCQHSWQTLGLSHLSPSLPVIRLNENDIFQTLAQAEKILTF
ncbi:tRNA 2-thiouridine synthesizing protein C [Volucribacter psittacicida]|uniref:tRNA 2-thiouridine synthesizing protein C n=1 Tax=Volucribacter psittacicida TaxID=203482 RepID=A0A4R1FM70_9PAST|nr:sulfurtransferase complex subunit TusC [Volucribacter psittacicida]TCJ95917.1 tRNA 2-thiouridine synthesizing protein C [Volucribacter psittacicida]